MYPENPEGTQVIVGSMNMGYISDTARNRTHNLFRPRREPIPLGHSVGKFNEVNIFSDFLSYSDQLKPILLPYGGAGNYFDWAERKQPAEQCGQDS